MELHAPTRQDREKWVHMFKLMIDMNLHDTQTSTINPFVYEKQKKYWMKRKSLIES